MNQLQFPSYASFSQDPLFRYALLTTLILHLLLLFIAWLQPSLPKSKSTPKAVVVKTVKLAPQAAAAVSTPKSAVSPTPAVKTEEKKPLPKDPPKSESRVAAPEVKPPPPKPAAPEKAEPKAAATPSKSTPASKPVPKKETPKKPPTKESVKESKPNPAPQAKPAAPSKPIEKPVTSTPATPARPAGPNPALLAEAKEALSTLSKGEATALSKPLASSDSLLKTTSPTLLSLESLGSSQQQLSAPECSYCEELAGRLKLFLRLPAYGEVKLRLTLKRNGHVAKVEILSSINGDNRRYVEKSLPELQFMPFGQNFVGEEQHTFLLTLTNE